MASASPAYQLYRLMWTGMDWILPPSCGGCGESHSRWCADCQQKVHRPSEPLCETCGLPLERKTELCVDCRTSTPGFRRLRAWSTFDPPVRNALHRLKYRRDIGLGDALAAGMLTFVRELGWPVDLVVPVPLGKKRLQERGYNQVGLIARPLALAMRISYAPNVLARLRETRSQVGLAAAERRENVAAAFQAKQNRVNGRTVLLIDDVATTGSTLSSCAEALYAARAQDVFALAVSRALTRHGLSNA